MSASPKTTEELIEDFRREEGRENSSYLLYERYYRTVYRYFQRKGFPPEDCRDLTQETFFSVYKGLSNLRQVSSFEAWLKSIAHNVWVREIEVRNAEKRSAPLDSLDAEIRSESGESFTLADRIADPGPNPMEAALDKEKLKMLRKAIKGLPPKMRECLQHSGKDLTNKEIAEKMGISVDTVKSHKLQAVNILKKKFGRYFPETKY